MEPFVPIESFLKDYVAAAIEDDAAVFVGAGLSQSAGFVDWKGLLSEFADELGLDLDIETDLVAVAQYHLNHEGRIRTRLNQKIVDEFARTATPGEAHTGLASLPLKTFWTSNYDSLIEDALRANGRNPAVRHTKSSLTTRRKGTDVEVVKLHGDTDDPDNVIITKDDYERYATEHPDLLTRLKNDLLTKSFLFIGFSFSDPNLELVFGQLRQWVKDSPRTHYAVFREPPRDEYRRPKQYKYELNRWKLRLQDLGRFGIRPVIIKNYDEIPELLRQVRLRVQRRRILVSGSFADPAPWTANRLERFCQQLGRRIIEEEYDLANGFGVGVGSPVVAGAVEQLYRAPSTSLERRLVLRPFPQTTPRGMSRSALWTRYRQDLIAPAGFAVFVAGNKLDEDGRVVAANGVREEFDIAISQSKYVLPVGATGSVSAELWREVNADFATLFPSGTPKRAFNKLGSDTSSNEELLDALFTIIGYLTTRTT